MVINPYSGKYPCFEGIDASGKSGQFARWRAYAQAFHPEDFSQMLFTKEPDTDHESGIEIYDLLLKRHPTKSVADMHPFEMQSHYFRNRIWHYKNKVIPALEKGVDVVSDRSLASICFGVSSPAEFKPLIAIEEQAFLGAEVSFILPDAILIYDVSADVARERLLLQGKELDVFERDISFQMKVRENYLAFADQYPNCHVVDASGTPEEIFMRTKEILAPLLGLK